MEFNNKRKRPRMEDDDDCVVKASEGNIYSFNNHIYFSDNITQKTAFQLCKQLRILETSLKMEAITTQVEPEIYLHITTDGGCVSSAFSIIDCMNNLKVPVNTVILYLSPTVNDPAVVVLIVNVFQAVYAD